MDSVNQDFWAFVRSHQQDTPAALRLKYHNAKDKGYDVALAIVQIECRKKFGKKLSETLERYPEWLFPSVLSGEQSTSDRIAAYHSTLVAAGSKVIDLTTGLGIDLLHLSGKAQAITACEIDSDKADALTYNIEHNHLEGITVARGDCRDTIAVRADKTYDVAFIDPARRSDEGGRVYALSDCQPDVTAMLGDIRRIANRLIVKMSPMLDITQTIRELPGISEIIALGVATECKEIVAAIDFDSPADKVNIKAVTLLADGSTDTYTYTPADETADKCEYGMPEAGDIIYEPYPTVMKAGPYKRLCTEFAVKKLHPNTHIYYSQQPVDGFPGIKEEVVAVVPFASKHIKRLKREYPKINVAVRNFPMSADKLRAKLGVQDGNEYRLLAVTLSGGEQAMIISRVFSC